jgi:hypothetical protein
MKLSLFKKKSDTIIKKESPLKKILSYKSLYIGVLLLLLAGFGYLGYFIYNNYYQTITQAKEIQVLRNEVAPDFIDTAKVERVINGINKKTSTEYSSELETLKNPFAAYVETTTPAAPTASTTTSTTAPAAQ